MVRADSELRNWIDEHDDGAYCLDAPEILPAGSTLAFDLTTHARRGIFDERMAFRADAAFVPADVR